MSTNPFPTWESIVIEALDALGGHAHLADLYAEVARLCESKGRPLTRTYQATVRRTCQKSARIVQDLSRSGIWRLTHRV